MNLETEFRAPMGMWVGAINDAVDKVVGLLREIEDPSPAAKAAVESVPKKE